MKDSGMKTVLICLGFAAALGSGTAGAEVDINSLEQKLEQITDFRFHGDTQVLRSIEADSAALLSQGSPLDEVETAFLRKLESATTFEAQGFDSICIDMQHGAVDSQVALTMLQAISTTSVIPLTRVPWNDPARLMKILDAGSYGVICPMINTPEQAEALVG